jgi:tetratricopeptide (TPR) repeat protein
MRRWDQLDEEPIKRANQILPCGVGRPPLSSPEPPDGATSLNNLGALYYSQRQYEKALPLYERALRIQEQVLGPEHPHTATSLNNLADLYQKQGRYEEAEALSTRRTNPKTNRNIGRHAGKEAVFSDTRILHRSGRRATAPAILIADALGARHDMSWC